MVALETLFVALALLPAKLLAIVRMRGFATFDATTQRRVAASAEQRLLLSWITWAVAIFSLALGADNANRLMIGGAGLGVVFVAVLVLVVYFGMTVPRNPDVPHQFVAIPIVTRPWRQSALNTLVLVGIVADLGAVGLKYLSAVSKREMAAPDCAHGLSGSNSAAARVVASSGQEPKEAQAFQTSLDL
jgi:hypothetical protein